MFLDGAISLSPTAACHLDRREPLLPHRRIDRRAIGPFQAANDELDLLVIHAMTPRNRFEEDSHRVIAFNHGDRVGRFHNGHACGHFSPPPQIRVTNPASISEILIALRIDGSQLRQIASLLIFLEANRFGPQSHPLREGI